MKTKAFAHQVEGTAAIVAAERGFALFDEMGAGKSKQVVDAACELSQAGYGTVVVVAPAAVRTVWSHPERGEVRKHSSVPSLVYEFHSEGLKKVWADEAWADAWKGNLRWIVTNYEFIRRDEKLEELMGAVRALGEMGEKTMLVLDESSYIKSRNAEQTKSVLRLRRVCDKCVILNGTPITNNPLDLWSQFLVCDEDILGKRYDNFFHFRASYAVMGGFKMKRVVQWQGLDRLGKMLAPHVLRRLKKDCLDLPEKTYQVREVALSPASWARYRLLREEALLLLGEEPDQDVVPQPNAGVKLMRMSQLTSGFVGLAETEDDPARTEDLSSEKLDWVVEHLTEWSATKYIIVWCRFRRERERLLQALSGGDHFTYVDQIYGGQPKREREHALALFASPDTLPEGERAVLVAQQQAGGLGLNLVAATEVLYASNDFGLGVRLQSEDRCHRPGQRNPVSYLDLLATGPKGQRTIDHMVHKALQDKQDVASLTTREWIRALKEEEPW